MTEKRYIPKLTTSDNVPRDLPKKFMKHGYEFAELLYSDKDEKEEWKFWAIIFFRNTDRDEYGLINGEADRTAEDMNHLAWKKKIIIDGEFRKKYLVDIESDESLAKVFKKWR